MIKTPTKRRHYCNRNEILKHTKFSRRDLHNALLCTVLCSQMFRQKLLNFLLIKNKFAEFANRLLNLLNLLNFDHHKFSGFFQNSTNFPKPSVLEVPRRYSGIGSNSAEICSWPIHPLFYQLRSACGRSPRLTQEMGGGRRSRRPRSPGFVHGKPCS